MMPQLSEDPRIVMTLDAGGTNLRFTAICGTRQLFEPICLPTEADNLDGCLGNIVRGFTQARTACPRPPAAISFAFPGPADYPAGVIGDLPNLPAFRGGVALGPMLEEHFGVPVYINNDGNLFAYGEAIAGFLPWVNGLLEQAKSPKRFENLFGVTLGTGLGGGIVCGGELLLGDNSSGGEAWLLRNKLDPALNAEEGACIRAVRRVYAHAAGIDPAAAPEPKAIYEIAMGQAPGCPGTVYSRSAAVEAFRRLGDAAGDAIAQALTLVDGLAVIGGGISGADPLFLPALVDALNDVYLKAGERLPRLIARAFNIEDPDQRRQFLAGDVRRISVPGSTRTIEYDPLQRTAVGMSRLGTSQAVAIGAYAFAVRKLDGK